MTRLLLAGGGHAHVEVLRRLAFRPAPDVDIVVVAPATGLLYSGMVPGVVSGSYAISDATIDVASLARAAGARFVTGSLAALDPHRRFATLANAATIEFDFASLDVGAVTAAGWAGADERVILVRPLAALLAGWARLRDDAVRGMIQRVAVVGGGAAGVELAFAMAHRWHTDLDARAPSITLVTDQSEVAAQHPPGTRRRLARLLATRAIAIAAGSAAHAVDAQGLVLDDGRRVAADRVVVATPAAATPWLRASGLACDDGGFVRVDSCLRSTSHPHVFAAGDCATQVDAPRPRSGVYAVRAGPALADNLRRALAGRAPRPYRPQRTALALISVGAGYAVASRPPWSLEGRWVWRWKDRIDRGFVARYRAVR